MARAHGVNFAKRCIDKARRILGSDSSETRRFLTRRYLDFTGKMPDLQNPSGFLEKLLWLNLYYHNPRIPPLVDKYLAREKVAELIGPAAINKLYGVWNRPEQIPFEDLPNQFVLKATAGSGWNILCQDKAKLNMADTISKLRGWQSQNYYFHYREWQYRKMRSRIIAERLLFDPNHPDRAAPDFKIFCFNGLPSVIAIISDRFGNPRHDFFDPDWNAVDYGLSTKPRSDPPFPRPRNLSRILDIARQLSNGFPFVRVDLYPREDQILFGEMTFSPAAGNMSIQQPDADMLWGNWLVLPQ